MSNKKIVFYILVLSVVVLIFHFYSKRQPAADETERLLDSFRKPSQWQGRYAPDFEIEFVDGSKFKLSDHIGKKVIILNFFATWCGPCKEEMPELTGFYEKHKGEPFLLMGINANEGYDKVREFAKELGITFPVGIDKNDKIQKMYTVRSYPTTILIGADGRVQTYEVGQITNADISFDAFYGLSMEMMKSGKGVERDTYLKNLTLQASLKAEKEDKDEFKLEGRAKTIAEKMNCPCGCSDLVGDCNCKTAKDIKSRLKTEALSKKTDEEIIRDLNKEFCVRGGEDGHDKS